MHHIILITIDTLRGDHCSCYGYKRDTTPFIDKMAEEGTHFKYSFANGPLTSRSFPSILCGVNAFTGKKNELNSFYLNKKITSIAEIYKKMGYETIGFQAGNPFISSYYGYDRGFTFFNDYLLENETKGTIHDKKERTDNTSKPNTLAHMKEKIIKVLGKIDFFKKILLKAYYKKKYFIEYRERLDQISKSDIPFTRGDDMNKDINKFFNKKEINKPIFMWIHYMDVHQPHFPKKKYLKKFGLKPYSNKKLAKYWVDIYNHEIRSNEQLRDLIDLYDCEIAYVDDVVKNLIEILKRKGISTKNSTFILTSDHGDEFGEHGGLGHELKLYNEMLSVPLIIFGKRSKKFKLLEEELIHLKSIIELSIQARSKLDIKKKDFAQDYIISESLIKGNNEKPDIRLVAIQNKEFKLIHNTTNIALDELYNIRLDPYEKKNIIDDNKKVFDSMIKIINKHIKNDTVVKDTIKERSDVKLNKNILGRL